MTARGTVIPTQEEGEEIQPEWVINDAGEPTSDPDEFPASRPSVRPKGDPPRLGRRTRRDRPPEQTGQT